ncbi:hypothetical protein P5673_022054 [Acropora cervicornis]|uniref:Uncharacterized protein n=1 Tax=Acropora cervicornis TaxID=6130 RepID=A0AAD9Q7H7_ACRCE|nr:hypothetical protein P5673_022054 [Acropora cervicornis]
MVLVSDDEDCRTSFRPQPMVLVSPCLHQPRMDLEELDSKSEGQAFKGARILKYSARNERFMIP